MSGIDFAPTVKDERRKGKNRIGSRTKSRRKRTKKSNNAGRMRHDYYSLPTSLD